MDQKTLIRDLYYLGFSKKKVGELLGESQGTVNDAIESFGDKAVFAHRPKNPQDVFATVLRRYAEIEGKREYEKEAKVLASWLGVEEIVTMLTGSMLVMSQLLVPGYDPKYQSYVNLLEKVFGKRVRDPSPQHVQALARDRWGELLESLNKGQVIAPSSREELISLVVKMATSFERSKIMPVWTEEVFAVVDDLMRDLGEEGVVLLQRRFGIGYEQPTSLEEIARERGLQREKLREIESREIATLRSLFKDFGYDLLFFQPVGNELRERLREESSSPVDTEAVLILDTSSALMGSIDDVEISPRLQKLLVSNGLNLIGEVVQKTEDDLKGLKFGPKVIGELKEVLVPFGLTLGMILEEVVLKQIVQAKAAYLRRQGG